MHKTIRFFRISRSQQELLETLDAYKNENINGQVVQLGVTNDVCKISLRKPTMALTELLDNGRSLKTSKCQSVEIAESNRAQANIYQLHQQARQQINEKDAIMMRDCGSYLDIVDETTCSEMKNRIKMCKCKKQTVRFSNWGQHTGKLVPSTIVMLKRNHGNLRVQTADELVEYSSCQYRQPRIVQWSQPTKILFIALVNQVIHRTRRITPTIDLKSQIYACVQLMIGEDFSQIATD